MAKRIALISDTHQFHERVDIPECDILIHSGDYSSYGDLRDLTNFNKWLGTLKQCGSIVIVDGNHDLYAATSYPTAKALFTNAIYIRDELVEVQGL